MTSTDPTDDDSVIVALADFRYHLRLFLRFSEDVVTRLGLEPKQHQFLLAVEALRLTDQPVTIGSVAERLQLRHHSVVGLADRLEARSLVVRERDTNDHRKVNLRLTDLGRTLLIELSAAHREELSARAPELMEALQAIAAIERREPPYLRLPRRDHDE